jgi:hypothetical protein
MGGVDINLRFAVLSLKHALQSKATQSIYVAAAWRLAHLILANKASTEYPPSALASSHVTLMRASP